MPTTALSPHLSFIQQRLPAWLHDATAAQRALLRQRVIASHRCTRQLREVLAPLQGIDTFCRPLLTEALTRWYPAQQMPSVDSGYLWNTDDSSGMSWLEAALQNFEPGASVKLYRSAGQTQQPLALNAARFVKGVRNLDLGQRYRDHMDDLIDTDSTRTLLGKQDRAAFAAQLTLAHLQGHLDGQGLALGEALLTGAHTISAGDGHARTLENGFLSLFDQPLNGPLLVRLAPQNDVEVCLLYLPGDSQQPLTQHRSMRAVASALTERLRESTFRQLFCGYVSHARQPEFAARLRKTLYPRYPYAVLHATTPVLEKGQAISWLKRTFPAPHDIWQETLDLNARLPLSFTPWAGECFAARARTLVERKLEDAASIAVPVAQRDASAQLALLERWLEVGVSVLNLAGFFVPGLGEAMLVVGGAQLVDEFLEGVHLANAGDAQAALGHLFDVLENLVQVAALGAAGRFIEPVGALHDWYRIGSGAQQRLWHGNLAPFSRPLPWPVGTRLSPEGLVNWQGQQWITLGGRALRVEQAGGRHWQLALDGQRHALSVQGNGQGSWLLEHESPLTWPQVQLLQRLGPMASGMTPERLDLALRCSGYDAQALRQIHLDHRPIPALLLDSLQALGARTDTLPLLARGDEALLARDFPSLSPRARKEILDQSPPGHIATAQAAGRLPLDVAERARLYLREARINRALARFHQASGTATDRDRLILAAMERLPGWTGKVRLELREQRLAGPLQASAGPEASPIKTVVRSANGYTAHDQSGQALNNRGDVFQAILQALPDSEREALGLQIHDRDALRDKLFDSLASDREQTALDLQMAPLRPPYRLPTRLPGSRRIGYPLSGRGAGLASESELLRQLFPNLAEDEGSLLQEHLRSQAGPQAGAFMRLLEQLRSEYQQLDETLQGWVNESSGATDGALERRRAARELVAQRIRLAWRRQNPTEPTGAWYHVALDIDATELGSLPTLPVSIPHIRQLHLSGLSGLAGSNLEAFLQALPGLRHLDLSANGLDQLPQALVSLAELQVLDLSENALNIDNPAELATLTQLTRLQQLNLTDAVQGLAPATVEHLAQLPHLYAMQLDLNDLSLDERHFIALQRLPSLRSLSLGQNAITLTEASRTALAGLNRLQRLFLYENPLELAPDVTGWNALEQLDLELTTIEQWPTGLELLMDEHPLMLTSVDLSRNDIATIPALQNTLFARAIRANDPDMSFSIDANPLDEQALLDLQAAGMPAISGPGAGIDWASDWPQDMRNRVQATRNDPQWSPLYALFDRLRFSADYERHPQAMDLRMRHVFNQLVAEPTSSAAQTWGRAQVQQRVVERLTEAAQTCVDQSALLFQQAETEVAVWQSVVHAAPGADHEQVASDALTSLLHERLLDERVAALYDARVARRRALADAQDEATRQAAPALHPDDQLSDQTLTANELLLDEMEMALHARMHLQQRLALPPQPGEIQFDYLAHLSAATLERLASAVQAQTTAQRLTDWALQQPFWDAWLRRLRPEAFEALANQWEGASYYFDTLNESPAQPGDYTGPTVPARFVEGLERDLPQVAWRRQGVLQQVDLASGEQANGEVIYQSAAQLLLQTRNEAEQALLQSLTTQLLAARHAS